MKNKLIVHNYIYETFKERGMKSFEKRVAKILRDKSIQGKVICLNAYKERASGYGQYKDVAVLEINNTEHTIKVHNTDSMSWDDFNGTSKEKRSLFECVISDYKFNL